MYATDSSVMYDWATGMGRLSDWNLEQLGSCGKKHKTQNTKNTQKKIKKLKLKNATAIISAASLSG